MPRYVVILAVHCAAITLSCLVPTSALAQEVESIETYEGTTYFGRVVGELETGLLIETTEGQHIELPFDSIKDIRPLDSPDVRANAADNGDGDANAPSPKRNSLLDEVRETQEVATRKQEASLKALEQEAAKNRYFWVGMGAQIGGSYQMVEDGFCSHREWCRSLAQLRLTVGFPLAKPSNGGSPQWVLAGIDFLVEDHFSMAFSFGWYVTAGIMYMQQKFAFRTEPWGFSVLNFGVGLSIPVGSRFFINAGVEGGTWFGEEFAVTLEGLVEARCSF